MNTQKYKDMAYNNSLGKRWYDALFREDIWDMWIQYVKQNERAPKVERTKDYAHRIIIEAVWHLGYAEDIGNSIAMSRCARRLRKPPERGAGVDKKGASWATSDTQVYQIPWEFRILDEFLENIVRPLI